jgi:type I restriction enzyme S subunit
MSAPCEVKAGQKYRLVGVRWYGEGTFERETVNGEEISAKQLFPLTPGAFIYNRLFAWKASFAVVPTEHKGCFVSSEFPQFIVDESRATAQYLRLYFTTSKVVRAVEAASVGTAAVSRNRFKEEEFLSFSIPLPPLPLQEATVAHWRKAQEDAAKSRDTVAALETEIQDGILNALRIKPPIADRPLSKAFALQWIDLERWSVDFLARDALSRSGSVSSFPMTILGALAQISYGIQKCPANRPGKHPRPYLRVANVQRGGLDLREIKYIDVPDSELETFRLSSGDLLVCEGNSADLVGRPALWNDEIPDCVHQNHVLRVRVDHYKALPEYVLEYMSTFCARAYFRSRAKFTTNLASINSNDLRGLPLPLPPLEVQRKIVNMVNEKRTRIAEERKAAEQRKAQATREVEEMILGVRPIG